MLASDGYKTETDSMVHPPLHGKLWRIYDPAAWRTKGLHGRSRKVAKAIRMTVPTAEGITRYRKVGSYWARL